MQSSTSKSPNQLYDVAIIGAGLAGLAAAEACEKANLNVLLLEATSSVGGRIKTDEVDGFLLDQGFQVLLTGYEKAQQVFDMEQLQLSTFSPGAIITDTRGSFRIGDPLREKGNFMAMATSRVGSLGDKLKMWQLTRKLKAISSDETFLVEDMSTMEYLRQLGFSERIISNFFVPFFGGIFLERTLRTHAGMFRFVFRYFSLGDAGLPANGMRALPLQLLERLKRTDVRFNAPVIKVNQQGEITLQSGEVCKAGKVIIACDPSKVLPQMDQQLAFIPTVTMYFGGANALKKMNRTIGLDCRPNSPINNYCRHDEVQPSYAPAGKSLWSVTARDGIKATHLHVAESLSQLIGCKPGELTHLKTYRIDKALPVVTRPRNDLPATETQMGSHIHLAGDYLLNGSIDAALRSGLRAAEAVHSLLKQ